jgi:hypothetical protein
LVPTDFHSFFEASAGVAGALTGLLFVALSVAPQWEEEQGRERVDFEVRAGIAFVALLDAVILSLYALIPGGDISDAVIAVSLGGMGVCVGLGVLLVRSGPLAGRRRKVLLIGIQTLVFFAQLLTGFLLSAKQHNVANVKSLATFTIAFCVIGIGRAWQLIGAREIGLINLMADVVRHRREHGEDQDDGEPRRWEGAE